jgi:homogentisate 1,2-dioxygenase
MPYYQRVGEIPRKRHTQLPTPEGGLYAEELMGIEGFSQESALLYHRHSPSAVVAIEAVDDDRPAMSPNHPVAPMHLRALDAARGGDLVAGRQVLVGNELVALSIVRADRSSGLYRNALGAELVYVQSGTTRLESVFGRLDVAAGDYVVIPRSTTHRWVLDAPVEALVFEFSGHVTVPRRYCSQHGQLLEGAPYSERDQRAPEGLVAGEGSDVPVIVRTSGGLARHVHATHPFDVVGWDGCLYPWALSIHDFEPIVGRIHQPPPVHQTFAAPGVVICSFVPRLFDTDANAVKIPYHHANVDSDEVLFYSDGDFMSRAGSGIGIGSISLHPAGFVHGPQPGSFERSIDATATSELAVMMDTFAPLLVSDVARQVSAPDYLATWTRT